MDSISSLPLQRGLFIVFEGLDRSGKSTQVQSLQNYFKNQKMPIELMKFPNREGAIGTVINDFLKSSLQLEKEVMHSLFVADRWDHRKKI